MKPFGHRKQAAPQSHFHIKRGDEVAIVSGTQKGKTGKVLRVLRKENRVVIEGINLVKKATRPTQENPQGGFSEREGPVAISNVMLLADYQKRSRRSAKASKTKEGSQA
ncbi:50S ribosomal protein L24 [Methylacidimicrobium cyclopophantes]|uniref:Large ribosomal subunit protein uL24 n=1 Tax=Methylacidimicrobium cyclopophantes TaxID=1041766 RepID=A0A5E6MBZ9_9BACT|nr:50S ribosomal protein L24 [Methylacidimicrobium cyclopophantes]VVM05855.1 50S ribosomal protein L24 [Methylacidimicrobium cyclopophantes]